MTAAPRPAPLAPSYRHAHWYLLAALAAIVVGFWPSFFKALGGASSAHTVHGVTATGWVCALIAQAWLASRGLIRWHRRIALLALVLLPVLVGSALLMVRRMLTAGEMPPFLPPLLSYIDLLSLAMLIVLVTLALLNRRRPAAHKRFMAATVLLAMPPALTRLLARLFPELLALGGALQASFVVVEVALVALIVSDWRRGEKRLAYPLSLAFFALLHATLFPVSQGAAWKAVTDWFVRLPIFG